LKENPVPSSAGGFTLLWVPATGLFYSGGEFVDGKQNRLNWSHTILVFPTFSAAEAEKQRIIAKYPEAHGEVVILPIKKSKSHGILED
jgi:hypothetical protein